MPTAFCATWENNKGPTMMCYAEYDGLPGNCQKTIPYYCPRDGLSIYAGGHTDPHSALGIGSLAGLLAVKTAMQTNNISGKLKFFGEPAEKVRGSKPIHAAKGYYDDIDAIISYHPSYALPHSNTTIWDTHCCPVYELIYTFRSSNAHMWLNSTWNCPIPVAHTTARAPGTNDSAVSMYLLTKMTKENMLPHSGEWAINETILNMGQATGDNLPGQMSQIMYTIRALSLRCLIKF